MLNCNGNISYILEGNLDLFIDKKNKSMNYYDISRLGFIYHIKGEFKKALSYYEMALNIGGQKDYLIYNNLDILFQQIRDEERWNKIYFDILANVKSDIININRATKFLSFRKYKDGLDYYKNLLKNEVSPFVADAFYNNFANLHYNIGNIRTAQGLYNIGMELNQKSSTLLFNSIICDSYTNSIYDLKDKINRLNEFTFYIKNEKVNSFNNKENKKIRIAYVITDLKRSRKCSILNQLIDLTDLNIYEVYIYTDTISENKISKEIASKVNLINCYGYSEGYLANCIIKDKIDILIDLNEISPRNRFSLITLNLSAIKISWFSFSNIIIPNKYDLNLKITSSKISKYLPIPIIKESLINFDKFNKHKDYFYVGIIGDLKRLDSECIDNINILLNYSERVRLVIQSITLDDIYIKENLINKLTSNGISVEKVEFYGKIKPYSKYLDLINKVDVVLIDHFGSDAVLSEAIFCNTLALVSDKNLICKNIYENLNLNNLIFNSNNINIIFKNLLLNYELFKKNLDRNIIIKHNIEFSKEFFNLLFILYSKNKKEKDHYVSFEKKYILNYRNINSDWFCEINSCYGDILFLALF